MQTRWPFLWHLYDELLCNSLTPCQDSVYALAWWCFHNHKVPFRRSIVIYFSCILEKIQNKDRIDFLQKNWVLHGILIRLKWSARDFFSCWPACVHARMPASTTRPVVPGCAGCATRGTAYAHLITTGTPGFSDLPTALTTEPQDTLAWWATWE